MKKQKIHVKNCATTHSMTESEESSELLQSIDPSKMLYTEDASIYDDLIAVHYRWANVG